MKIRIILTVLISIVYCTIIGFLNFYHSVIAGVANAQQANDTIAGYTISKFISEGYLNFYLILFFLFFLAIIWLPALFTSKNNS